jgi:hypothetical protein
MGTYNFSAQELSQIIVDAIENVEGDFGLQELKLAFTIAYSKLVSESIKLENEFFKSLKIE